MSPISKVKPNAQYTQIFKDGTYQFHFHCDYCEEGHTTGLLYADCAKTALRLAWQEARENFNGCHKCGKWICNQHYNIDEMMCTDCTPFKNKKNKEKNRHGQ